jgi:hypothetical protein
LEVAPLESGLCFSPVFPGDQVLSRAVRVRGSRRVAESSHVSKRLGYCAKSRSETVAAATSIFSQTVQQRYAPLKMFIATPNACAKRVGSKP